LNQNAFEFGQNFFCVNLQLENLSTLKEHFQTLELSVIYKSGEFKAMDFFQESGLEKSIYQFKMSNGDNITLFSKSPTYKGYLFEGIIEPYYQMGLMVESWGRPYQKAWCTPHHVYNSTNVKQVKMSNGDSWTNEEDHSKWAVPFGGNLTIACVCDMNRMYSQVIRGGGAFCYNNTKLYKAYKNVVAGHETCPLNETSVDWLHIEITISEDGEIEIISE